MFASTLVKEIDMSTAENGPFRTAPICCVVSHFALIVKTRLEIISLLGLPNILFKTTRSSFRRIFSTST